MENWVQKNHLPLIFTSSSWVKMIPPGICSIKMNPAIHRKSHTWCQYSTTTPKFHWKKKKKNCYDLGKRFLDASPGWECRIGAEASKKAWGGTWTGLWRPEMLQIRCCQQPSFPFWIQEAQRHSESCSTWAGAVGLGLWGWAALSTLLTVALYGQSQ